MGINLTVCGYTSELDPENSLRKVFQILGKDELMDKSRGMR